MSLHVHANIKITLNVKSRSFFSTPKYLSNNPHLMDVERSSTSQCRSDTLLLTHLIRDQFDGPDQDRPEGSFTVHTGRGRVAAPGAAELLPQGQGDVPAEMYRSLPVEPVRGPQARPQPPLVPPGHDRDVGPQPQEGPGGGGLE